VVAKLRERLAVRKQAAQKFNGEKFNRRKPNGLGVKEKYQIEITNRFAALENLTGNENINGTWENIKENIKTSAKESLGLHEWKQAKVQWIQDPRRSNVDNLNNVRRNASRHFRNKKKAHLKAKIEELETNSNVNNVRDLYRGINDFKKGYQPRTIIVKDEKGELVADHHSIMARWRNYFSQLLNVPEDNDVRQAEIHTVEPLVPEPSAFEVELAIGKLKNQITRY